MCARRTLAPRSEPDRARALQTTSKMRPKLMSVPRDPSSAGERSEAAPAATELGRDRTVSGSQAIALGLLAAARLAGLRGFLARRPGEAVDIGHELARHRNFDFTTFDAENDTIACWAAIGAAYGGALACMTTSAAGVALEHEALRLASKAGLPLVIVDVQRGSPTALSRNPAVPVVAASSPSECFDRAVEAARIAVDRAMPVILLVDGSIADGRKAWKAPEMSDLEVLDAPLRIDRPGGSCTGCGDAPLLAQVQRSLAATGMARENPVFVSGIGCSNAVPPAVDANGFHTIHGRSAAIATGLKAASPQRQVWVVTSDTDALSTGGNHLIHALRRNVDVKIVLFNGRTSRPQGSTDRPVDTVQLALASGATFVARSVEGDAGHLGAVLRRMGAHEGAAFLEVLRGPGGFDEGSFAPLTDEWDERRPAFAAYTLAGLRSPTRVGVFRAVQETTHHEMERRRTDEARHAQGEPDLEALLRAGEPVGP